MKVDTEQSSGVGRPSKLTPAVIEKICEALSDGNSRRAACGIARISEDSFGRWMKDSEEFAEAVREAEAEAEVFHVANVKAATTKSWYASAWWLERRRPKDWGKDALDDDEEEPEDEEAQRPGKISVTIRHIRDSSSVAPREPRED